jgi:hypothetical protein
MSRGRDEEELGPPGLATQMLALAKPLSMSWVGGLWYEEGGGSVGVLDRQTYQGGTRGSRLCSGDRDRETENSKVCARIRDTRFIQVRVAKVANPTSCLEIRYGALRLVLVEIRCPARYPTLLYIVQGRIPSRLQGRSPSRITRNDS